MPPRSTPGAARLTWTAVALFAASILAASGASHRDERVLWGALPMGWAMLSLGGAWWMHGRSVIERRTFVWRSRRYTGQQAARFGRGMQAGGLAFGLLGLWVLAIWLRVRF